MEIWKDIPGIDGYQASNIGRIRNAKNNRVRKLEKHHSRHDKEYYRVGIKGIKKGIHFRVHRLVALAFIGPPPDEKSQVAHADDNGLNNKVENLSYKSHIENQWEKKCKNCPGDKHCYADHEPGTGVCFIEGCMCSGWGVNKKEKVIQHVYGQ